MGEERRIKIQKMLFVDDRTKRIHYALTHFPPEYDVTIATCVPEALRALCSQQWDVVSLDHDLNGHDFQDPDTPTCGMEIVRYIEKCGWPSGSTGIHYRPPAFVVHSSNIFAAHLMIVRLSALGLSAHWHKITYPVENMRYNEQGQPKIEKKTSKWKISESWSAGSDNNCWRCGVKNFLNNENLCHSCWGGMRTGKLSNP